MKHWIQSLSMGQSLYSRWYFSLFFFLVEIIQGLFQRFSRFENAGGMNQEILFLNGSSEDPYP